MQPMLDDLELPQVQEIATLERRVLAEQKPPGMSGSLLQNLGRRPLRVALWGVVIGPESLRFVEKLDEKFRAGRALPFTGDIIADARLEQVVIDDLHVQEVAGKPQRYSYTLTLQEFIEPVEPADASALNTDILDEATGLMDNLLSGFEIVEQLSAFVSQLTELKQALQRGAP